MTSPSIVRAAVPEDRAELWRLFRMHHAENALFPISEEKVGALLDRVLHPELITVDDAGPRGLIGVIGEIGELEGAIMLILGSPWYTDTVTMDDCLNFVDPAHRASRHSEALIRYSKNLVDQVREGHPDFKMLLGVVSTQRTAAKVRLFSRHLTPVGAFFMYPPPQIDIAMKLTDYESPSIALPRPPQRQKFRPHRDERNRLKDLQTRTN